MGIHATQLLNYNFPREHWLKIRPWVHAMRQQAIDFLAPIRGEMKPMCEAAEAVEELRVAHDNITLLKGI